MNLLIIIILETLLNLCNFIEDTNWPFMVSIGSDVFKCGGSIVGQRFVLTRNRLLYFQSIEDKILC